MHLLCSIKYIICLIGYTIVITLLLFILLSQQNSLVNMLLYTEINNFLFVSTLRASCINLQTGLLLTCIWFSILICKQAINGLHICRSCLFFSNFPH